MHKDCIYELFWYELDQSISIGQRDEFLFFKNSKTFKFFNGLYEQDKVVSVECIIKKIIHPEFGEVSEISTTGLDYSISLVDGTKFEVEAEENPGHVYNFPIKPKSWKFNVLIDIISPVI